MGESFEEKVAKQRPANNREIHTFTIPPPLQNGIKTVGLVELTAEEELNATKRAQGDGLRLAYEMTKISLVEIDGKTLVRSEGDTDAAFERMHPKVRSLVVSAFNSLHAPDDKETLDFLKSRSSRV
jgi:hypothetical protein